MIDEGGDVFMKKVQQGAFFLGDDSMRILSPYSGITSVVGKDLD